MGTLSLSLSVALVPQLCLKRRFGKAFVSLEVVQVLNCVKGGPGQSVDLLGHEEGSLVVVNLFPESSLESNNRVKLSNSRYEACAANLSTKNHIIFRSTLHRCRVCVPYEYVPSTCCV